LNLAFTFNVKNTVPSKNIAAQIEADFDAPETIAGIKKVLETAGHCVTGIEADEDAPGKLSALKRSKIFVFNIAEGLKGEAREAQMPSLFEMLQIPYTHSGPLAQAISLDKTLTKIVLLHHGIRTPKFQFLKSIKDPLDRTLRFPLIVKPNSEGSSIGIFNDNLVFDELKLFERIGWIFHQFHEPVLIEEYIDGREFTVSVLGNNPPRVLPIVEQNFSIFPENMPRITSYEAKWFFEDHIPDIRDAYFCPADISSDLARQIENISLQAYKTIDCKDVARIDFRVDKNNRIYVIEINTLPGMIPDPSVISYLPIAAKAAGISYEGLVNTILNEAVMRYGLLSPRKYLHLMKNYLPQTFLLKEA
jgi:D-alanine-D-alanine ligase